MPTMFHTTPGDLSFPTTSTPTKLEHATSLSPPKVLLSGTVKPPRVFAATVVPLAAMLGLVDLLPTVSAIASLSLRLPTQPLLLISVLVVAVRISRLLRVCSSLRCRSMGALEMWSLLLMGRP